MGRGGFRSCPSELIQEPRRTEGIEADIDAFERDLGGPSTVRGRRGRGLFFDGFWLLGELL